MTRSAPAHGPTDDLGVLAVRGVSVRFRRGLFERATHALQDLELDLETAARLGLVGPNGSGKSTFLALCGGVRRPTSGSVRVFGQDPASGRVSRRIGYLPEDSPFPSDYAAERALALLGAVRGLSGRDLRTRVRRKLEEVGLAGERRLALGRFSRGMLRRFGLAQAALHEPDLLLLDEPTAGLDAPGYAVLEELLDAARARRAAVVLATHLELDVERHCEELALFLGGRLRARGPVTELLARRDRTRIELGGLGPEAQKELVRELARRGARDVEAGPARLGLLELYERHRGTAHREIPQREISGEG